MRARFAGVRWCFAAAAFAAVLGSAAALAWGPHAEITQAAVDTLPPEAPLRAQLGADLARLRQYCWMADSRRSLQREADAWFYADDYLLFPAMTRHVDHLCPDVKQTYDPYFRRALQALRTETPRNAARWIGSILHFTEDTGSPPHSAEIRGEVHSKMENWVEAKAIHLGDYRPQSLGATEDEAVAGFQRRMDGLIEFSKKVAERAKPYVLQGDRAATEPVVLESALETSRVVADLLCTLGQLAAQPMKESGAITLTVMREDRELPLLPVKAMIRGTTYSTLASPQNVVAFRHLPAGEFEVALSYPGGAEMVKVKVGAEAGAVTREVKLKSGSAGAMLRGGQFDVGWLALSQPDGWYPVRRKGEEPHWESDLLPLTAGKTYELRAEWQAKGDAQALVHLLPKALFQGLGKDEPPVTPQSAGQRVQATAEFPWAQVWVFTAGNPRQVLKSVSFSSVP